MQEPLTLLYSTHAAICSRTFPGTLDQVPAARGFLGAILADCPLRHDAVACLGELVNNAVIHSRSRLPCGTFTVRIERRAGRLRIEVHDDGGPWRPGPAARDGAEGLGGRGLLIVAALAGSWDITPRTTADQRIAFFEMDMPVAGTATT